LVADEASDDLAGVRADIRRSESRLRSLVDRLVEDLSGQGGVAGFLCHAARRRPLRVSRAGIKQIARLGHSPRRLEHGRNRVHRTASVVEAGNAVEEMRAAEAREVHRVCLALTRRARAILPGMRADTERLARLDSIFGRARAAGRFGWKIPQVVDRGPLRLLDAHHPLLHLRARERSIGVRLTLEAADRSIVVSGPNTGGKTTLLKTLGLAAALVQCGIPAPLSPDSRLPVFADIWADIGDAQDVASGQSTFSAHAARLADIVKHARERTLILLDELGTATDPAEGAALAVALLDWLCHRGSLTLATSHLTPLKQWRMKRQARATPRSPWMNASAVRRSVCCSMCPVRARRW
jgi:DNA mismatch repair protein MutS2